MHDEIILSIARRENWSFRTAVTGVSHYQNRLSDRWLSRGRLPALMEPRRQLPEYAAERYARKQHDANREPYRADAAAERLLVGTIRVVVVVVRVAGYVLKALTYGRTTAKRRF